MLIFGIILYYTDQKGSTNRSIESWSIKAALKIGLWQVIALIPGSSRSGMTIIGARNLGFNRVDSANISMLMSIPTIIASGTLLGSEVFYNADWEAAKIGIIAAIFSFFSGLIAIKIMMHFLNKYQLYTLCYLAEFLILLRIA